MAKKPSKRMGVRATAVALIIAVLGSVALTGVLAKEQLVDHEFYSKRALEQQTTDSAISAKRGSILDCNGVVLAQSATVWDIVIDPSAIEDDSKRAELASGLAEILELDFETVYAQTKKNNRYERIKRRVEMATAERVREFVAQNKITCVTFEENSKRYYPYGNFASHIIGFTGSDNQGLEGVEAYYDGYLRGTDGRVMSSRNTLTGELTSKYETRIEPIDGYDVYLTLIQGVQNFCEKHLKWGVERARASEGGCAIVMNVKTGAVLGMAVYPDYDLNSPYEITDEAVLEELSKLEGEEYDDLRRRTLTAMWNNKAVTSTYDPGSVFKMFTMSMALEEGVVNLNSTFYCSGGVTVADRKIGCWYTAGHGSETLTQILENSCNPGFIKVSSLLGVTKFCEYVKAFGFLGKTGIDISGESAGVFFDPKTMGAVELAVASFGQTFTVSPLQVITAICAVANGGYLVQPHILGKVVDSEGKTIEAAQTVVRRQVISNETSKTVCKMLESVVTNGTGKNAYVAGYRVGGKTGTSQKIQKQNETGRDDLRIASFAAIAPADDPQIAVLVMIDEPNTANRGGSACAAPVVAKILEDALPYLGVEPSYTEKELAKLDKTVPDTVGFAVSEAKKTVTDAGFTCKVLGDGERVIEQMPRYGDTIPAKGQVVLVTEGAELETVKVPDLMDMTSREANAALTNAGLNIRVKGTDVGKNNATVNSQSVAPGTEVPMGTVISVTFVHYDQVQ
ncbi:MAG: PASTA domain-containing protein [Clostridia bacterium]|nr:PASTA domain-containing protein [Clostridia bacterium]